MQEKFSCNYRFLCPLELSWGRADAALHYVAVGRGPKHMIRQRVPSHA